MEVIETTMIGVDSGEPLAVGFKTIERASIYDRSRWPTPASNPLIQLFERGDDWFSNSELLIALGYSTRKKSLIAQWPTLAEQLGDTETSVAERGLATPNAARQPRGGGVERYFSRKALVLIAMRAQTINAASFCDWLAEDASIQARIDQI